MTTVYTRKELLFFCLFVILATFPFVEFLGKLPLRLWDESRVAANAIEMYINHDWLVTYYNGTSDTWNTKPPLLIWLQVVFMHLFGVSVTSLRLVSAIAGILTALFLFHFIKKESGNIWLAFFSGIALISMEGFNGYHAARTADYDALLALFSLLCVIQFYNYICTSRKQHILLFFLFLCLAWFTKSISSLFFLPAFFIYAFLEKKVFIILKDPYFYLGLFSFIIMVFLYYAAREHADPGYIQQVYSNEIGGRYLEVAEGHRGDVFFYLWDLSEKQIYIWFYVFLITLVFLPFISTTLRHKKFVLYLLLLTVCFLIVLTISQTKIEWYDVPVLPLIAALSVLLLFDLLTFLECRLRINTNWSVILTYTIVIGLAFLSYINIVLVNYHPEDTESDNRLNTLSSFFQENENGDFKNIPHLKILANDFTQHLYYYVKKMQISDPAVGFADYTHLEKGEHVIGCDEKINEYLKTHYSVHELYRQETIYIYAIK